MWWWKWVDEEDNKTWQRVQERKKNRPKNKIRHCSAYKSHLVLCSCFFSNFINTVTYGLALFGWHWNPFLRHCDRAGEGLEGGVIWRLVASIVSSGESPHFLQQDVIWGSGWERSSLASRKATLVGSGESYRIVHESIAHCSASKFTFSIFSLLPMLVELKAGPPLRLF